MSDQNSRREFLRQAAIAAPLAAIPYVFTTKAAAASEFRSRMIGR